VVSVTDSYGRIFDFLHRSRYFSIIKASVNKVALETVKVIRVNKQTQQDAEIHY
jgi:hypothetical protein